MKLYCYECKKRLIEPDFFLNTIAPIYYDKEKIAQILLCAKCAYERIKTIKTMREMIKKWQKTKTKTK